MTRWFFPVGIAFILVAAALSHWEHVAPQPGAPTTHPSRAVEAGTPPRVAVDH